MIKRVERKHLQWKKDPRSGVVHPFHRVTWMEGGKQRERTIKLKWGGDAQELDRLYWLAERGKHAAQKVTSKWTWGALIREWRADPRIQKKLADSTKVSYRRTMDRILAKNEDMDLRDMTRQRVRAIHTKFASEPRKADHYVQGISLLWNYGKLKLDWPIGDNPASGVDLYGKTRAFEPWPAWMSRQISDAPDGLRTAYHLIVGTGQRPSAAIAMEWSDFDGDRMTVLDEKADKRFEVFCPPALRAYLATIPRKGQFILAKNLREPLGYSAIEKQLRPWRKALGVEAAPYSLHGLRKLAIVQLAEAGCSDAEIQAVTNQSAEMVAYYRKEASRLVLSKKAQEKRT